MNLRHSEYPLTSELYRKANYFQAKFWNDVENKSPDIRKVPRDFLQDRRSKVAFKASQRSKTGIGLATRPHVSAPGMVTPYANSVDPTFGTAMSFLADTILDEIGVSVNDDGFVEYGHLPRAVDALRSATGIKPSISHSPSPFQPNLTKNAGLATKFVDPIHEEVAIELHKIIFGTRVPSSMKFVAKSQTMMPDFLGGEGVVEEKQMMCSMLGSNLEDIMNLILKKDLQTLYKKYHMMFSYFLVQRMQPEGNKDRFVIPFEHVMDENPELVKVSKTSITGDILGLKDRYAQRHRVAFALNGQINMILSMFLSATREFYLNVYAATWHHTTPEKMFEQLKDVVKVVGVDMSNMDQWYLKFKLELHARLMGEYYGPAMKTLIELVNGAAYFSPQSSVGGNPFWVGDPLDLQSGLQNFVGLASGRADNPDLGKWGCTTDYILFLYYLDKTILTFRPTVRESVEAFLRHEHPVYILLDMGDDAVFGIKDVPDADQRAADMRALLDDIKTVQSEGRVHPAAPYSSLAPEEGTVFLGNVISVDDQGNLLRPYANPSSWLVNRHAPENGIESNQRRFWALGMEAAREHYSSAGSIIGLMEDIEEFTFKKFFPDQMTPKQYIHAFSQEQAKMAQLPPDMITPIDAEVLIKPETLHYKYLGNEVSEQVRNMFIRTIPTEQVELWLQPFTK